MATDTLTVKVEFNEENAMNCIKNVLMNEYGMTLDELAELCKAKQEGRLVELKCKPGDVVYMTIYVPKIKEHEIVKYYVKNIEDVVYTSRLIGKTAFFTMQEAEAKLKEVQNDG